MLPDNWDAEADIVVVGFGGASRGAVTAFELGAEVLILEKAPEGEEAGTRRLRAGLSEYVGREKPPTYLRALCGSYKVPDEMIRAWSEEMCLNNDWLSGLGGDPQGTSISRSN